jgi:hypothetical protein
MKMSLRPSAKVKELLAEWGVDLAIGGPTMSFPRTPV